MPTEQPLGRPRYDDLLTPAEWRVAEAVRYGTGLGAVKPNPLRRAQ